MRVNIDQLLAATRRCMDSDGSRSEYAGPLYVGVDLGTAYAVLLVLGEAHKPLAGAYRFAEVVRDGVIVDFHGAIDVLQKLKGDVEERLGRTLHHAASAYPPGIGLAEVRATRYVLEAVGLDCSVLVDEPSAANAVLQVENGAVVDVGGGTTGIAVIRDDEVIHTADEPTGGTHFTLVIAGALKVAFERAEELKLQVDEQARLLPLVRPVMEKVASIIARHIEPFDVQQLYLVGGATNFLAMDNVIADYVGLATHRPRDPLFVTPLGIAMHDSRTSSP